MIKEIPLQPIPSQKFSITINQQNCSIWIYQKGLRLYFDLNTDDKNICTAAVCLVSIPIIQRVQGDFQGNFIFISKDYKEQPNYENIGRTHFLIYYTDEEEIPIIQRNNL